MAALKVSAPNGVKVYNVAGGKSLPEWLSEKKRAALRKDEEFRRRVELIQARCAASSRNSSASCEHESARACARPVLAYCARCVCA